MTLNRFFDAQLRRREGNGISARTRSFSIALTIRHLTRRHPDYHRIDLVDEAIVDRF